MGLFSKKNAFLGIDFGSQTIKVVELTLDNQRPLLTNYALLTLRDNEDRGVGLRAVLKKMKPKSRNAYVALPGSSGLVTIINFPQMSRSELAEAVAFEARKHIPLSLDDVNVSWDVVGRTRPGAGVVGKLADVAQKRSARSDSGAGKDSSSSVSKPKNDEAMMKVLLVAAPKKDVAQYESYLRGTSLVLRALELETFSLVRSLVGEDAGTFLVVDIGAQTTNIVLVRNSVVHLSRNIGIGGAAITDTIVDALHVSAERAEAHKKQVPILTGDQAMMVPTIDAIIEEVRRVIAAAEGESIDNIILAGGVAQMLGLEKYFAAKLGTDIIIGNPWARVSYDEKLENYLEANKGAFSIAVGLALRGMEEYQRQ